jgi:hypothetical protein
MDCNKQFLHYCNVEYKDIYVVCDLNEVSVLEGEPRSKKFDYIDPDYGYILYFAHLFLYYVRTYNNIIFHNTIPLRHS